MNNLIKIGFTGSRKGLTIEQKQKIIEILNKYINHKIYVYHGDCVGADTDFHDICVEFRNNNKSVMVITIIPPDKDLLRAFNMGDIILEPLPYLERNTEIVLNSDIIIGCPQNANMEVLRSGTWSTIRKARKMKKILFVF